MPPPHRLLGPSFATMNGEHDEPDDDDGIGGAYVAAYLMISAGIVVAALCAGLFAVFSR